KYSSNQSLLTALKNMTPAFPFRRYTTLDVKVGTRYDRYSFLDESAAVGKVGYANDIRMDIMDGYGLHFFWGRVEGDGEGQWARPVIYFVEGGSPGHQRGITRGSTVLSFNDIADTRVAIECNSGGCAIAEDDQDNANRIHNAWYAGMDKANLQLRVRTLETTVVDHNLTYASSYDIKPIIA